MSAADALDTVLWMLLYPLIVPVGLLVVSVPVTTLVLVRVRAWQVLGLGLLALHGALLLVLLARVADGSWTLLEALIPFAWVVVPDAFVGRALLRPADGGNPPPSTLVVTPPEP